MTFTKIRFKWGPGAQDTMTFRFGMLNIDDPYLVKSITGLEPPTVNVSLANKAEEGVGYQSRRPDDRQIVMTIGFQPDYGLGQTVEGLRRAIYPMIAPKLSYSLNILLLNETETEKWQTWGYVSKTASNPFSKDPDLQLTIDCLGPYWLGTEYVHPSLSTISGKSSFQITNAGDAPSGFELVVALTESRPNWTLYSGDQKNWTAITYNLGIGDQLTINTIMGSRSFTLLRSGVTTNMLQYLTPNSTWLQLDGGLNTFSCSSTAYTVKSWKHTPRYWGI